MSRVFPYIIINHSVLHTAPILINLFSKWELFYIPIINVCIHTLEDLITKDTFELEGTGPVFRKELEEVINEIKLEVQ